MIDWPEGKRFAFTIVDDTDSATVANVGPVYELLAESGLRTTKTVWPLAFTEPPLLGGGTLQDPDYRAWVLYLRDRGFEIALHGATDHSSRREDVIRALDAFREVLGEDPRMHVNHVGQLEQMYWGADRLDGLPQAIYRLAVRLRGGRSQFYGHVESSPYFWGDVCRERVQYVRNFVFRDVNTLAQDPLMPYHDSRRPFVRFWYSASEAADVTAFCELVSEENQDRLVEHGGACIAYAHLASGFCENGRPHDLFEQLVRRLGTLPGWFVPASTMLDFLRTRPGWKVEADRRVLGRMQRRWLAAKLRYGTS